MLGRFARFIVEDVRGRNSVQEQNIGADFSVCEHNSDTGEGVVERTVVFPPRLVNEEGCGIVALADSAERVTLQVLTEQVDAMHGLPLIEPLEVGKIDSPSAKGERFGENLIESRLSRRAGELESGCDGNRGASERIHAGNVEILIHRHDGAVAGELGCVVIFAHHVPCEFPAVRRAPVMNRLHEIVHEQARRKTPETPACAFETVGFEEERGENVEQLFTVSGAVFVFVNERPRNAVAGDLRFVGEEALHLFAFGFGEAVVVFLMNNLKEFVRYLAVERIDIVGVDVETEEENFTPRLRLFFGNAFVIKGINRNFMFRFGEFGGGCFAAAQILLPILKSESVDNAVAESAWPAVFIVSPRVHVAFFGRMNGGSGNVEPVVGEVVGEETSASVHEKAADSGVVHQFDLAGKFTGFEFVVPAPEGNRTVILGRIRCEFYDIHEKSLLLS